MKKIFSIFLIAAALTGCKHKNKDNETTVGDAAKAVVQSPVKPVEPVKPVDPVKPIKPPVIKEGEVKNVCVEINGVKKCKNVKMHKKFEGTKIPPKK